MPNNFEQNANSIHESTNVIVDRLINSILLLHHQLLVSTGRIFDSLLDSLNNTNIKIQIEGQKVYDKHGSLKPTIDLLTVDKVNAIKVGLENPWITKSSLRIFLDNKPILDIHDGQILRDDVGLTQVKNQNFKIDMTGEIEEAGTSLVTQYGYQVSEDISAFRGQNYYYELNHESFSIHAYGRGTVFKDGYFTELSTDKDQKTIMKLPQKVQKELNKNQQQIKQKSLNI
ncbi:MAG: hypothetical protein AAF316_10475 [Cyanobacteria bacterium P01_A01_bin.80]